MTILKSVMIISGLGVFLASLITLAGRYLTNYGQCTITINGNRKAVVDGGNHLLATLKEQGIFIPSACGGRGSCGLCKLAVLTGGGPLLPTEKPFLTPGEIKNNVRLSCQVKVRQDMEISIPEELFGIREYRAQVSLIEDLTHDIKTLYLDLKDPLTMEFTAGQYIQIKTPLYGSVKEEVYRAYSIASSPSRQSSIQLIIRRVPNGICTSYVFDYLKEGDSITFNGPYGDFYLRDSGREIIFIAGGSGLGPIKSILHQMEEENIQRKATFFFGCVGKRDLYYIDEMKEFEKTIPYFRFIPALSASTSQDDWKGERGLITEVVDRYIESGSGAEAYLCGSPGMIDACIKVLKSKGIGEDRIFYDKF